MPADADSMLDQARREDGAGNHAAALMKYRVFLRHEAGDPQAWADYAGCLLAVGRYDDSLGACDSALGLAPGLEPALTNRAAALMGLGRLHEAGDVYRGLLSAHPEKVEFMRGLYRCLKMTKGLATMEPELLKVLDADPGRTDALSLLIIVYTLKDDREKLLEYHQRFLDLTFEGKELFWERSALLLKLGDYKEGFRLFDSRPPDMVASAGIGGPVWRGERFEGRRLLVHWEHGFGDTLMFLRYGPMLKALGGDVLLSVQPELVDLAGTCAGFDRVVPGGPGGSGGLEYDLHISMMSLPMALGTELHSIPAETPYLRVPPAVKHRGVIQERLRLAGPRRKIGLVWAGKKDHKNDHLRSIPAGELAPLGRCEGTAWFALQRETPDILPLPGMIGAADLMETFADTALLIDSMDAVVTADTATAHLAGALGKPTMLMLPFWGEWRWLTARGDSPWYPSIRIHRQDYGGAWAEVAESVCEELNGAAARD